MATLAMAVSACGAPAAVPELTARSLSDDGAEVSADPALPVPLSLTEAEPTDTSDAASDVSAGSDGTPAAPSLDGAMAARLAAHVAEARKADHLAADVTGDGLADLVVAAIGTDAVFSVTLSTWDGAQYTDRGRITAATPDRVGTPAVRDLDGDGRVEVLAPYTSGSEAGVVVAVVADDAGLVLPASCPVTVPASYKLRLRAGHTTAVVLACEQDDPGQATDDVVVLRWNGRQFAAAIADAEDRAPATERVPTGGGAGDQDPAVRPGRGDDPPGHGLGPDGDGPPGRGGRD
jgi:hypothetical protein